MKKLWFSQLYLLSQKEKSAFKVDLSAPKTLLVGMNGGGKSAILKSLYNTLGAKPHKVDKAWKSAGVISVLHFSIDGNDYVASKSGATFSIFDAKGTRLIETTHVTRELGPAIADLLEFRLVLSSRKDSALIVPPPSFAFAPYYIDQDNGWNRSWSSFEDFKIVQRAAKSLSEYHSGIRANDYYLAKANRDSFVAEQRAITADKKAIETAIASVRAETADIPINLNLNDFEAETFALIGQAQKLHEAQSRFRVEMGRLSEERFLWVRELGILDQAINEIEGEAIDSFSLPEHVDCPMCGQHYTNDILAQFDIVSDRQELEDARSRTRQRMEKIDADISEHELTIDDTESALEEIGITLSVRREEITLRDVIAAKGKAEALLILSKRLEEFDLRLGELVGLIKNADKQMREAVDKNRTSEIMAAYRKWICDNAEKLDVVLDDPSLEGVELARGSAGPRGLAAYYYAFCNTARKYGSSAFCPIVIDEPNQQGQDSVHMPMIMEFLFEQAPADAQIIVAAEKAPPGFSSAVVDVSWKKGQVLQEGLYEEVAELIGRYVVLDNKRGVT